MTFAEALAMALEVRHTGSGGSGFTYEAALHTYLSVSDVRRVSITGLAGVTYLDKTADMRPRIQDDQPITIRGETDRVYLNTRTPCVVDDPGFGRRIIVEKSNSDATVVWNPWKDRAAHIPDFACDEWPRMLCIETCNVADHAVWLAPGQSHTMTAILHVKPTGVSGANDLGDYMP